jgi:phage gpG-like protein
MPAVLESRIPEIIGAAEVKAETAVSATAMKIEAQAKKNLVSNGSVETGNLLASIESHVEGPFAEVGTNVEYSVFVEYGTGQRGAESEFEGKPDDISYTLGGRSETRQVSLANFEGGGSISERAFNEGWMGMSARPFLTPAAEEQRAAFIAEISLIYG